MPTKRNRIRQQHNLLRKCRWSMITGPVKTDFLTLRLLLLEILTSVGIPYFIWTDMSCGLRLFPTEVRSAQPKVIAHVPPNGVYQQIILVENNRLPYA
jgi:hypothetical protein